MKSSVLYEQTVVDDMLICASGRFIIYEFSMRLEITEIIAPKSGVNKLNCYCKLCDEEHCGIVEYCNVYRNFF
ncbi:unnamed protein product [Dracunculus medinensis]|uniref:ZP domain-containing protein n=1 Tax=Dracunculus medinensis TaxID=318479 RepID=A0A0N4U2D3_DRAME|nr:unnamed protein product [Dracunculus medinensis]